MDGLTAGRIVHYVMNDGQHRPAIIVKVWNTEAGIVNLQVFTDGLNDRSVTESDNMNQQIETGVLWRTSIPYDDDWSPSTWHWIERA